MRSDAHDASLPATRRMRILHRGLCPFLVGRGGGNTSCTATDAQPASSRPIGLLPFGIIGPASATRLHPRWSGREEWDSNPRPKWPPSILSPRPRIPRSMHPSLAAGDTNHCIRSMLVAKQTQRDHLDMRSGTCPAYYPGTEVTLDGVWWLDALLDAQDSSHAII